MIPEEVDAFSDEGEAVFSNDEIEGVFSKGEDDLSSDDSEDAYWHDEDLDFNLENLSSTAFDEIMNNARDEPVRFHQLSNRPLTYTGTSARTQRRKRAELREAAKGCRSITEFLGKNHGALTSTDDVDNSNDGAEVEDDSLDDEPVSTDRESEFVSKQGIAD